ncbi:ABC transporter substrate-binding protein [Roseococcus sp. SYP-B2431]|uniref:ABC transporter substrate-binding protein n=1 Tax=Roseococcus sp. SYP-B2431 TaxID=2496640 RepID=UPI00103A8AEF|nr:ABC transporter substrate-binding protein [Roseococcus sp. SYP-B2431]TCH99062.1 ABC transporter substrate-binding protein [Roseococcus sp. SYP-B2431]
MRLAAMAVFAAALALPAAPGPAGLRAARAADLNLAVGGAFSAMDPHYHDLSPNHALTQHIFEQLVMTDSRMRPIPGLALSWEALNDNLWEVRLRRGVIWHDGSPFTADDVVFTYSRIPHVINSPTSLARYTQVVSRIEVIDDHTIRLHTPTPVPLMPMMLGAFTIISRRHGTGALTSDYNSGRAAIGTGPYRFVSYAPGDRAVFARHPGWWGPTQAWDRVTYRMIPNDSARVAALRAGDVDAIDAVPTRDVAALRRSGNLRIVEKPGLRLIYLYVDVNRPVTPFVTDHNGRAMTVNPLADVRVRRALSIAINRPGMARQLMEGFAVPTGQLMPEGALGYDPTIPVPAHDVEGARRLLAEAGYPQGFRITLNGPNDRYVNDAEIVQAIAQFWTRIGVRTEVATMPASMFFSRGLRDEYSVSLTGWSSSTGEADTSLTAMSATPDPPRGRGSALRPSHYTNPAVDALIDRALATIDTRQREALYQQAIRDSIQRDIAVIPLHHQVNIWATKPALTYSPRMQELTRAMEFSPVTGAVAGAGGPARN